MKELVKSSGLVAVARILGIVLQGLTVIYLARSLPVDRMGVYALCYALLGFARTMGPFGIDQIAMRRVAVLKDERGHTELHRFLNTGIVLTVALNLLPCVAALVAGGLSRGWLQRHNISLPDFTILICTVPAYSLIGLMTAIARGFERNVLAQFPDSVLLQAIFGAGLLAHHATGITLPITLLWQALSAWIVVAVYVAILVWIGMDMHAGVCWQECAKLVREGRHIFSALVVTSLSIRAPILISAPLLGAAATAVLDVASRFGTLPTVTTSSVSTTFSPQFAILLRQNERKALSRAYSLASLLAGIPAVLCLMGIVLFAPLIVRLALPPVYTKAILPMFLVALATTINAVFGISSSLIFMAGRSSVVTGYSLAQLITVCLLSVALGLKWGPTGIACGVAVGAVVRDFGAALWVGKAFGVDIPPFGWRKGAPKGELEQAQ